ncbi:MAG: DEAD/DEAH box helicase [Myxococcales bacterium]|nr:DEAD/DEAH box helicase [Myxococcales bacterium]MCB9578408.1 DEAD/DEAH box helicase [Polyangiaceae bacterium]
MLTSSEVSLENSVPVEPRPCLRLFAERLSFEDENGRWGERLSAVISLRFQYGRHRVRVAHLDDDLEPSPSVTRHLAAEARAQQLLERFGAVEIECVDGCVAAHDSEADYLVNIDDNVHAVCSFSAHAVRELTELGFSVEIDEAYPYRVVEAGADWYAKVAEVEEETDWFSLELGVEVNGRRVDLLPALVELVDESPDGSSLASLARHAARYRALPVGDGYFVAIPWQRLRRVLSVLSDLYTEARRDDLRFHAARAGALGELDEAMKEQGFVLSWDGGQDLVERGAALCSAPCWTPPPAALRAELRPYQHEGLSWMAHLRDHDAAGVLADDMGLGKTLQTIALFASEKEARRMDLPSLIVMPTSLTGNWRRELKKFAPHLRVVELHGKKRHAAYADLPRAEIAITSYPVLVRDRQAFLEQPFHYLVLDEAQAIKNPRSQAARAIRELSARHRLCLTGTPVENNLEELWSLFDFLMPGLLGSANQFRSSFRLPIERDGNDERLAALQQRVAPYILRRLKESVAKELPPKTELVRSVELSGEQRDLYESIRVAAHGEVRQAIRKKGFAASSITILDALTKLRQVCCDPRLVKVDAAREVTGSAKRELFFELLERQLAEGRKVLVFSQFARMLAILSEGLAERGVAHVTLTGASQDRQSLVDRFQGGEVDVFLISLKAGGTGLNLTRADTVIHYDPWWNAAAQMQATDRAYRIGQTAPVFVHNLVVAGSVEERMLGLQRKKRHLAESLLSGGPSVALSQGDLDDLFAPLSDDDG